MAKAPSAKSTDKNTRQPWGPVVGGLAGLLAIGSVISYLVPSLPDASSGIFHRAPAVNFHAVFAMALLAAAIIIYLSYYRVRFLFSTRWLVAVATYNVLVLFVKFTISDKTFGGLVTGGFGSVLFTALMVAALYIGAFGLLYLFFDGKLLNRAVHRSLILTTEGKALLAMGLFVCASAARVIIFRLPGLSGSSASTYLNDVFATNTLLLSLLLFVMIFAAVEAYAQVRRRADLAQFFVSGAAILGMIHIWWAICMYRGF